MTHPQTVCSCGVPRTKKKEATGNEKGKQDEATSKLFNTPTPVSPVSGTAAAALRDLQDE